MQFLVASWSLAMNDTEHQQSNTAFSALADTAFAAKDFIAELGDVAIDIATDSVVLEKVPILSWAIKAWNIKSLFLLKRMQRNAHAFLQAVMSGDQKRIESMFKKIKNNPKYADEFTDTTLSILIESEKPLKANLVGKLIVAMSNDNITASEFETMSLLIMASSIPALNALSEFYERNNGKSFVHSPHVPQEPLLLSTGLCHRNGALFAISDIGQKLFKYGFDGKINTNIEK
jgi:hypothetical protein